MMDISGVARLSLAEGLELAFQKFQHEGHTRSNIHTRLIKGDLAAYAEKLLCGNNKRDHAYANEDNSVIIDNVEIPSEAFYGADIDWRNSFFCRRCQHDYSIRRKQPGALVKISLPYTAYGVSVNRNQFATLFGMSEEVSQQPAKHGGRPAEYDWENAVVEMARIVIDDGAPNSQADMERRIMDWFAQQDQYPSQSSVKTHVRRVFSAWRLREA